jgi:membrane protease YdiL (CAAX protease family)
MSWLAGRTFDYRFLAVDHLGVRDLAAAAGAMLLNVACFLVSRRWRTEEERKKLAVWGLVPRNAAEWRWVTVALLAAGVVEEIAYRGVGMSLLWWMTGSPWIAVALCAAAFAAAHAIQGGRSMLIVLVMALIAHGLVAITGTLVIAMVVHVLYDLGAVLATARKAAEYAPLEVS